jgi:prolyl-tRNA editing enzyme YbaK/EbsC (Cys-tRNA(Pro) deacylase)
VSWPALRRHFGRSRLTTATRDEVLAVTGYEVGAVAPFGLRRPVEIVVDESVLAEEELSMGSGLRGTAVILSREDLLRALGEAPVGRFAEAREAGAGAGPG